MSRELRQKFRGARRYYARLQKTAATFAIDLTPSHWYDLWHLHLDRSGYTRRSSRARRKHLDALFGIFKRALEQAARADRPVQVFVSIAPEKESDQDALYVHTPNPNGTPFPHAFDGVAWGVKAPAAIRSFVETESWDVGAFKQDASTWWVVRERSR